MCVSVPTLPRTTWFVSGNVGECEEGRGGCKGGASVGVGKGMCKGGVSVRVGKGACKGGARGVTG